MYTLPHSLKSLKKITSKSSLGFVLKTEVNSTLIPRHNGYRWFRRCQKFT